MPTPPQWLPPAPPVEGAGKCETVVVLSGESAAVDQALRDWGSAMARCEAKRLAWERAWAGLTPPAEVVVPKKRFRLF